MEQKYYLPINSANIGQYFSRSIILPNIYINGWIRDIQSKYDDALLLSSMPLTNETNCSLTIAFSEDELIDIKQISENFYTYDKPLSIARVKNINFSDNSQAEITVYNIEQGDAFIPRELVNIVDENEAIGTLEIRDIDYSKANALNWNEKIDLYNRVLGGFSLMRIADFKNVEYPKNYFNSFAFINKYVSDEIHKQDLNFDKDYHSYINIYREKGDLPSIYYKNRINLEFAKDYAKEKENIDLPEKRGLIRIEEIDENKKSYILSILATYGADTGKTKKIADFISALKNDKFPSKNRELLCLAFGVNQGYSAFRNMYSIGDQTIDTKFKLDSEVDYTIIESIYQYVFNGKKDNTTFSFIGDWCPKNKQSTNIDGYEIYEILDKIIAYKKKVLPGSREYLQELFQLFSNDNDIASIFTVIKPNILDSFKEKIEKIYTKIKNEIELEQKQKIKSYEKEQNELNEKITKLKIENKDLQVKLENSSNLGNTGNNEIELEQKQKIESYAKELNELNEQVTKLKSENKDLRVKLEHPSDINSIKSKINTDLNDSELNNNKNDTYILKNVAKDIQSIGDLQTIAKHLGIEKEIYKKYKKSNIEELRQKIIEYKNSSLL